MRKFFPWFSCIVLLYVGVRLMSPLFARGFFQTDDGDWMIIRLSAFYQSLREGQFPVRFLGRLNNSFGYPVSNFLYPGYLYIGSVLHFIGLSFVDSVKIICGGSIVFSTWFLYRWLRIRHTMEASHLGAVLFLSHPYIGYDLFVRGSVGELLAILAATGALWSIGANKRVAFSFWLGFLILAHNSLAILFFFMLFGYVVAEKKLKDFVLPALLGLGTSAFFWIPALAERSLTIFDQVEVADSSHFLLSIDTLWLVATTCVVLAIAAYTKKKSESHGIFFWFSLCMIVAASPLAAPLWEGMLINRIFQFPYRLFAILPISIATIGASVFGKLPPRLRLVCVFIFLAACVFDVTRSVKQYRPVEQSESFYTTNEATTTVRNEYMPRWVSLIPTTRMVERIQFFQGNGRIAPQVFTRHAFRIQVEASENSILQFNTIYYPGWGAAVDGVRASIDYSNPSGLMRIPIKNGLHTVEVAFRETPFRFFVDCLSLSSILCLVFMAVWTKRKI